MRKPMLLLFVTFLLVAVRSSAQDDGGYKLPPKDIADLLLAKPTPSISIDRKGVWL
jgi:hypothetical protein